VFLVKLRKRGVAFSVLLTLIIAILVLTFWLYFYKGFGAYAGDKAEGNVCLLSVIAAANTKVPFIGLKSEFDLKCPIQDVESNAKTKDEVNRELASDMAECWINYGQGKLDYYSKWDWGSSTKHCRICSKITFDNGAKAPTYAEFGSYLSNTNLPGQRKTFAEFFTGTEHSQINLGGDDTLNADAKMDLSEPAYVVFRVEKHNEDVQAIKGFFSATEAGEKGLAGGGIILGKKAIDQLKGQPLTAFTKSALEKTGQQVLSASGQPLYGAAAKTALEAGSAKLISTSASTAIKKVAGVGIKTVGKLVPTVVKKAVSRFAGPVGWTLLAYDVAALAGTAGEFYPSLAVYSVNDIKGVCDDLS